MEPTGDPTAAWNGQDGYGEPEESIPAVSPQAPHARKIQTTSMRKYSSVLTSPTHQYLLCVRDKHSFLNNPVQSPLGFLISPKQSSSVQGCWITALTVSILIQPTRLSKPHESHLERMLCFREPKSPASDCIQDGVII